MNNFDEFMKTTFKKIVPWVGLAFGIMLTIAGSMGVTAAKNQHYLSGGQTPYVIFLVFYWIIAVCALACVAMKIMHKYSLIKPNGGNATNMYHQQQNAPAQNTNPYAAPNAQQTVAPAEKFCPNCGAKVPEGSAFCTNCGNKV